MRHTGKPYDLSEPDGFKDGRVIDYYRLPDEFVINEKKNAVPGSSLYVTHKLTLEYISTRKRPTAEETVNPRQWRLLTDLMHENPMAAQVYLRVACSVCYFDADQAKELIAAVRAEAGDRVDAMVHMLSRLVDPIRLIELFGMLSITELKMLKNRVGEDMFHFNPRNPTGHYQVSGPQLHVPSKSRLRCGSPLLLHPWRT